MPDIPILWIVLGVGFTVLMAVVGVAITIFVIIWLRKSFGGGPVKNGVNAPATILRIWDTGTTINNNPLVGLELEVTPPYGQPFQAECKQMISRLEVGLFQPGMPVSVSYDPSNPKKIHITAMNALAIPQYGMPVSQAQMDPAEMQRKIAQIDAENESLLVRGQSAQAEITRYTDWNVKVNGENPAVTLQLRVMPVGKPVFMAEASGLISVTSVPKYQPGKTIWVKYDPNNLTKVSIDHS
jgi:hypothetical protein